MATKIIEGSWYDGLNVEARQNPGWHIVPGSVQVLPGKYRGEERWVAVMAENEAATRQPSKREAFAMAAMQGMLADPNCGGSAELAAKSAVQFADALLAELAKEAE